MKLWGTLIYKDLQFESGSRFLHVLELHMHYSNYKKHIDASVKERPQTRLVPSEEICKRVLCNKHI